MILNDPWEQTVNLPQVQHLSLWRNVLQFLTKRIITLGLAVITAVYLTIIIANFGGFVDDIVSARIELQVGLMIRGGWLSELPPDERIAVAEQTIVEMQDAAGLNDPFLLRSARWLWDGLTLNWGEPERARIYDASATNVNVRDIIADNLSRTLLVFGVANVLMFVTAVFIALLLNRRHGGFLDRAFILLSPISSAPAWVYGVLLSTFLLRFFGFSSGGTLDFRLGDLRLTQLLLLLRHLLLPFAAMFLAGLFQTVYTWRSFFQVYRNEEYVDMAYAKGLSNGRIDRHYIMRPALPALLTSFALMLAVLWQEVIALEFFFNVQGIGRLFARALAAYDTPMIVAIVTTFAYLLAITVLILDVCYALVDPRVRVGSKEQQKSLAGQTRRRLRPKRRQRATSKRVWRLPRPNFVSLATSFRKMWVSIRETVRALREYKTAVVGLTIILFLVIVSIYTVITIPYSEAIAIWHGEYDEWSRNPREALPSWVNLLRGKDLPPTLTYKSTEAEHAKQTTTLGDDLTKDTMSFAFDYDYADFPQDIILDVTAQYAERGPHVAVIWVSPDGTERELSSFKPNLRESYFVSQDKRLQRRLRSDFPHQAIFLGSDGTAELPIPGTYTLRVDVFHFEPDSTLDVDVTILGQVHGLAGTDTQRRDLMLPLLWGTPIALTFGLIAAIATSVGGMFVAAIAAWYGGVVDRVIQFLTDVNLILPFFPVSLMIFILYSKSIITILAVTVALTIFGSSVKTYRATFLQVKNATYVEAARAYGASDWRIVVRYMIPKIMTVLLPKLIILVPSYVFLEATLAFLGVTDPILPTWGKLIVAALSYGIHRDAAHIVIAPLSLLFITGFAFAMVGIALEQVFDPRLREANL